MERVGSPKGVIVDSKRKCVAGVGRSAKCPGSQLTLSKRADNRASDSNHEAVAMTNERDFDFKIGRGHYRGHGTRGLIALTIVHVTRIALYGAGGMAASSVGSWLWHAFQTYGG